MRTRMYGGVRGRKTKVGGKPTLFSSYSIICIYETIINHDSGFSGLLSRSACTDSSRVLDCII